MARIARFVAPGRPHHVTQRGNRREQVFFSDDDYSAYLDLLGEHAALSDCAIWAYCLMPNHVHIVAVPATEDGLRALVANVHKALRRSCQCTQQGDRPPVAGPFRLCRHGRRTRL